MNSFKVDVYEITIPATIDGAYSGIWDQSLNNVAEYIDYNTTIESFAMLFWKGYQGCLMLNDMVSGFTNNTVNTQMGHACPFYTDDDSDLHYWYSDSGEPTYLQNCEAWAEYFSSIMSSSNISNNKQYFGDACKKMENIAEVLLEGYRNKHYGKECFLSNQMGK